MCNQGGLHGFHKKDLFLGLSEFTATILGINFSRASMQHWDWNFIRDKKWIFVCFGLDGAKLGVFGGKLEFFKRKNVHFCSKYLNV